MKRYLFVLMTLILLASACAQVTSVPTPVPSTSTSTPVPPTATSTITPTATPDLRVIDVNPKELILGSDSLPAGGKYGSGVQEGSPNSMYDKEYLTKSGRVYGFGVTFTRGSNFSSPMTITDEAVLYQNSEGAKYALEVYVPTLCQPNLTIIKDYQIADGTLVCTQEFQDSVGVHDFYLIYFSYKNVGRLITGTGLQGQVSPEFMQALAQDALQILQKAPLANAVTFTP